MGKGAKPKQVVAKPQKVKPEAKPDNRKVVIEEWKNGRWERRDSFSNTSCVKVKENLIKIDKLSPHVRVRRSA